MFLNDRVEVALPRGGKLVWCRGTLVGRTLAAAPRYDVRLLDGQIIANVSSGQLRPIRRRKKAAAGA